MAFSNEDVDADDQQELQAAEAELDKKIIKMYHKAIKDNRVVRALDLASRLHLQRSYGVAMQVAQSAGASNLGGKVQALMMEKFQPVLRKVQEKTMMQRQVMMMRQQLMMVQNQSQNQASARSEEGTTSEETGMETSEEVKVPKETASASPTAARPAMDDEDMAKNANEIKKRSKTASTRETSPAKRQKRRAINKFAKKTLTSPSPKKVIRNADSALGSIGADTPSPEPKLSRSSTFVKNSRIRHVAQKASKGHIMNAEIRAKRQHDKQ